MTAGEGRRGIVAAGVYVPRARVTSEAVREAWGTFAGKGIDTAAVPAGDEDALTMGVAAARRALDNASLDPTDVTTVAFATTTPPLAEEGLTPRLGRALGLSETVRGFHHGQSTAAGADALETALSATGPALAVVADAPTGDLGGTDHAMGAGAAAFVVGEDAPVTVVGRAAATDEAPGLRLREPGGETTSLDITSYERGVVRETVRRAVAGLDVDPDDVGGAAVHQPNGSLPYRVAGEGIPTSAVAAGLVVDRIGDAGAATVPIGLAAALESVDESTPADGVTLAAFFGSGSSAVAVAFEGSLDSDEAVTVDGDADESENEGVSYVESLRKRGRLGDGDVAGGGANVSLPNWRRTLDGRYLHTAGRCPACDALSFPGEGACDACHERVEFERVPLEREGTVEARTVIGHGGAPPEFVDLQRREGAYGAVLVRLAARSGGGSVVVPAQVTDCDPGDVAVGDAVRTTVRRIYTQEGVSRYGAKFVPAESTETGR
ncbi:3-hydroxy-3-methylglutaryl CoA synthase [Salinigranum rubrum]|uniref:3-hydroxy-3-methylglutaryl CoA synthase n=1 Tax=Salinigranum rubrum TaxID=755307 RepID=A0A2I8VMV6_9EURY|nr:3-hydroxy-3-methylglutaryl CoA synthase [Salinigranum rubrum]AUV83251.1 3-hydroxy-3-methylglutaryl CoA synthase [Salinigranum rubrum]